MKKILAICLSVFSSTVIAGSLLVTIDEMMASNNAPIQFTARNVPPKDAPVIELVLPKIPGQVSSPTVIDLKFQPTAPSTVKPDSFRVFYGSFGIDITKRLLNVAKVSETGVFVQEASLPKGKHKLQMIVEDSTGRKGSRVIEFEVN